MNRAMIGMGVAVMLFACGGTSGTPDAGQTNDAGMQSDVSDGAMDEAAIDASDGGDAGATGALGTVTNFADATCPAGAVPPGSTCKTITVSGCPGLENDTVQATLAILEPTATLAGVVTHFTGSGGTGFQKNGATEYQAAGFRQVFVSWNTDWETTTSAGIKAAACRPATVLRWIFDEPTLQAGSRTTAFCAEGFSAGSGQLGYSLAQYGLGDYLDYVNEMSGPPFARIDLGCDGNAPTTTQVCGATDTMQLPVQQLNQWENIQAPNSCGGTNVPQAEIDRWKNDSIAIGGVYDYPKTEVQFYDCTYQSTAVTGMAQIYEQLIAQTEGASANVGYHCYTQADGCDQENLGNGNADAVQSLIAGCVPRH